MTKVMAEIEDHVKIPNYPVTFYSQCPPPENDSNTSSMLEYKRLLMKHKMITRLIIIEICHA